MDWTRKPPTVSGWYWYKGETDTLMVFVDRDLSIEQGGWHVSEIGGAWYGPLEIPIYNVT